MRIETRRRAAAAAARLEEATAKTSGGKRIKRGRYESAADITTIVIPELPGRPKRRLVLECKYRSAAFTFILKALAQAQKYDHTATPAAVLRVRNGRPLIVLDLKAFTEIAGINQCDKPEPHPTFTRPCAFCTALEEVA